MQFSRQPDRPVRAAFFVGGDVTAHFIVNRLIHSLRGTGTSFLLFLTRGKSKRTNPMTLRQLFFVEHTLMQEYAFPYVDACGQPSPWSANTPNGWRLMGLPKVEVCEVADVNDPSFVSSLSAADIDVAFSVRCYQRFHQPILDTLGGSDSGSMFINLHPGLLPRFRGVNTFLRSMQQGAADAGFTLHHLEPDWDTGPIIGQAAFPLRYSLSVHENLLAHVADAAGLIHRVITRLAAGQEIPATAQDHAAARYFSYPSAEELLSLSHCGIEVFRAASVVDALSDAFFASVPDVAGLREYLNDALDKEGVPHEDQRASSTRSALAGKL
jgi:methionyl-tRNA formyltransferase